MKEEEKGLTRRGFLRKGSAAVAAGAVGIGGGPSRVQAKGEAFATLIDLPRCDGCKGDPLPRCVAACRQENQEQFPIQKAPVVLTIEA